MGSVKPELDLHTADAFYTREYVLYQEVLRGAMTRDEMDEALTAYISFINGDTFECPGQLTMDGLDL